MDGVSRSLCLLSCLASLASPVVAFAQAAPEIAPIEIGGEPAAPAQPPPPTAPPQPVYAPTAPAVQPTYVAPQPMAQPPEGVPVPYAQPGELPPGYAYRPAPPQRPLPPLLPRRIVVDTTGGLVALFGSGYNDASHLWGFNGFSVLSQIGLDVVFSANRYLGIGAHLSWGQSSAGHAPSDQAELSLQAFDLDVLARLGYPITHGNSWVATPGIQIEAGGLGAWATLRNQTQNSWMPRFAVLATLSMRGRWFGFHLHVGYQRAVWPDAGGHGVDLALEGVVLGAGLEVAL